MRHPGVPDPAEPTAILVPAPARPYRGIAPGSSPAAPPGPWTSPWRSLPSSSRTPGGRRSCSWCAPGFPLPEPGPRVLLTALLVVLTAYLAVGWVTTGQTYGARLLGLRVVDRHGHRLGPGRALVRAVLCVLFPLLLFWVVVSRENRSVQDVLLRTSVVYDWSLHPPPHTVRRPS